MAGMEVCTYCCSDKVIGAVCLCGNYEAAESEPEPEDKQAYEGGATRSKMDVRLDLVPKEAIMAMARRLTLGADRHGANNWRKGGEEFRLATISHLMKHLLDYIENGNRDDANSDAIICNAAFLCEFERRSPHKGVSNGNS